MLTRVEIENFKAIEKLTMDFTSRLTVIVGPNGSGKTSVLQAINSSESMSISEAFRSHNSSLNSRVKLVTSYGQMVEIKSGSNQPVASQRLERFVNIRNVDSTPSPPPPPPPPPPPFGCVLLRFVFSGMGLPTSDEGNPPPLDTDGSNLASVLSSLCLSQPERFATINNCLREIIPGIRRIRFERVKLPSRGGVGKEGEANNRNAPQIGDQLIFDTVRADAIPADSMSEGTLLALGIVTAMVLGEGQRTILIDDLDASLHPSAQAKLVHAIRTIEQGHPDVQVIATSHSPYLLHSLEFDEVRLTTLRDDGTVACGRLTDHPDFEKWKDEMTPGEMWSMFGEKWLVDASKTEPVA